MLLQIYALQELHECRAPPFLHVGTVPAKSQAGEPSTATSGPPQCLDIVTVLDLTAHTLDICYLTHGIYFRARQLVLLLTCRAQ